MNFDNISFTGRITDEWFNQESEFDRLLKIKNSIDLKLKELEEKMNENNTERKLEATKAHHLKAAVYFSFSEQKYSC